MSEKYKKTCKYLNYVSHLHILVSTVGCPLISAFASLICIPVGITSSAVGLKTCAITAGSKKYKSITKKKKNEIDKIELLGKTKLNIIKILISKVLTESCISRDKFVSVKMCPENIMK